MPPNTEIPPEVFSHQPDDPPPYPKTIVVVGLGMVAVSFIEKIREYDIDNMYEIKVFSEEPVGKKPLTLCVCIRQISFTTNLKFTIIVAYNRVGLTQYFSHRNIEQQLIQPQSWYDEQRVELFLDDPVEEIDSTTKRVRARKSGWVSYDILVLATGSSAALPPGIVLGMMEGVYVYRTLQDLQDIINWSNLDSVEHATIVGGGLLGLEAAKAAKDLGLKVTIYERSDRLMSRQLDQEASRMLEAEIKKLGLEAVVGHCPMQLLKDDNGSVMGVVLSNGEAMETQLVIYAIGIRARDQLADTCPGLEKGDRGGFKVNERLETSLPDVYAIGECASYNDMIYGLVAPGYE